MTSQTVRLFVDLKLLLLFLRRSVNVGEGVNAIGSRKGTF